MARSPRFSLCAVLLPATLLAGCISFGATPPPSLLVLTSEAAIPVGRNQSSATARTITVAVPSVPQSLATARIPVQATPTSIAYVEDALWAEPPARLFARLLSDTVAARTGRVVLGQGQAQVDPGARLGGDLRSFGIDAATNEAVATYDAALIRVDSTAVEQRRFEARVPVAAIDAASSGIALNQAANQVAAQVADWVGR